LGRIGPPPQKLAPRLDDLIRGFVSLLNLATNTLNGQDFADLKEGAIKRSRAVQVRQIEGACEEG
jgi:hypothetical protein